MLIQAHFLSACHVTFDISILKDTKDTCPAHVHKKNSKQLVFEHSRVLASRVTRLNMTKRDEGRWGRQWCLKESFQNEIAFGEVVSELFSKSPSGTQKTARCGGYVSSQLTCSPMSSQYPIG